MLRLLESEQGRGKLYIRVLVLLSLLLSLLLQSLLFTSQTKDHTQECFYHTLTMSEEVIKVCFELHFVQTFESYASSLS